MDTIRSLGIRGLLLTLLIYLTSTATTYSSAPTLQVSFHYDLPFPIVFLCQSLVLGHLPHNFGGSKLLTLPSGIYIAPLLPASYILGPWGLY